MSDDTTARQKYRPRRLLNPRRVQSMLKRAHETLLDDSKDPKLTAQEKVAILKASAEYTRALSIADGRRRTEEKARRAANKKLGPLDRSSPWE